MLTGGSDLDNQRGSAEARSRAAPRMFPAVAVEPKGDTQVRVRAVITGWLGIEGPLEGRTTRPGGRTYSSRSLASYLTILPSRIVYSIRARRS